MNHCQPLNSGLLLVVANQVDIQPVPGAQRSLLFNVTARYVGSCIGICSTAEGTFAILVVMTNHRNNRLSHFYEGVAISTQLHCLTTFDAVVVTLVTSCPTGCFLSFHPADGAVYQSMVTTGYRLISFTANTANALIIPAVIRNRQHRRCHLNVGVVPVGRRIALLQTVQ